MVPRPPMSERFPLQTLLDLAQTRTDDAARRLGELIAGETETQRKLDLLENYRAEYQARFVEAARNGIGPDAWRNYSTFIDRLDEAISAQRQTLESSRQATSGGQQVWLGERNRLKAFDTLSQRHTVQLSRQVLKQEQQASDEHGAKNFRERSQEEE